MTEDRDESGELPNRISAHRAARFSLPNPPEKGQVSPLETPRPPTADEQYWQDLVDTFRRHRRMLLRYHGVTAVDIGYRVEDDHTFSNELAIRVHVERKLPDDCLKEHERLPTTLPETLEDPEKEGTKKKGTKKPTFKVNVIEAKYKPVQHAGLPRRGMVFEKPEEEVNPRRRLDPLVGGISIGGLHAPVGTLGALVWDNVDGSVCILSNWHVLAGDLFAEVGAPCFQPGRFDQGRSNDVVAHLKRWTFDSQTDAALAQLNGSRHYCAGEIASMYQQISGIADPYLGMKVLKSGRSSGFTRGFVDGLYFSSAIEYSNGLVQVFEDQIHIAPRDPEDRISEPGDSGSVWVTNTRGKGYAAVGLHFAGDLPHSPFGEYALANPMNLVAQRLNFSFRPRFIEVQDEDSTALLPSVSQPLQVDFGAGAEPVDVLITRRTGSGGQTPEPASIGGGGNRGGGSNPGGGGRGGGR